MTDKPTGARTIEQFCEDHNISRGFYYVLRHRGEGPVEMKVGARRLISDEAAADWRRARREGGIVGTEYLPAPAGFQVVVPQIDGNDEVASYILKPLVMLRVDWVFVDGCKKTHCVRPMTFGSNDDAWLIRYPDGRTGFVNSNIAFGSDEDAGLIKELNSRRQARKAREGKVGEESK